MRKKWVGFIVVVMLALSFTPQALAASEGTTGDYMAEIGTKFGRGLWNVISSPAEIPCTMKVDANDKGGSGYVSGFGKGIVFMLRRILIGTTEVGTFMIPMDATIHQVCKEPIT